MDRIVRFWSCRWSASQAVETSRVDLSPWPPQAAEAELAWSKVKAAMKKERWIRREVLMANLIYIVGNYIVLRRKVSRLQNWWVVRASELDLNRLRVVQGRRRRLARISGC